MRMRFTVALIAAGMAISAAACSQMGALKAKMAARDGHTYYQSGDYRRPRLTAARRIADRTPKGRPASLREGTAAIKRSRR